MAKKKTRSTSEKDHRTKCKYERLVLAYLRQLTERPYEDLRALLDPRNTLGLDSIVHEMHQANLINIVEGYVSITTSGLRRLEEEKS